jgi:DNA (cytosine-5)-methyltransferase 1
MSPQKTPIEKSNKLTMVELFAGVGGFRLAAEGEGFKTVFWNQWEPSTKRQYAQEVYLQKFGADGYIEGLSDINFTEAVEKLTNLNALEKLGVGELDLLVGGFPCQDYSVAKSNSSALGLEGKKGVLWWDILKFVKITSPKFIFLENVDRLIKSPSNQRGRDFAVMLSSLALQGYQVEWRIITASEYGALQRRKRIFIIASKVSTQAEILNEEMARELLVETGLLAKAFPVLSEISKPKFIELYTDIEEISEKFGVGLKTSPFENSGVFRNGLIFTCGTSPSGDEIPGRLEDALECADSIPDNFWLDPKDLDKWKDLKGGGSRKRTTKDGFSYLYSEGAMSFPDDTSRPARTILTGEGGTTPSRFKHVIEQDGKLRRLVPKELERLNGFPDDWTIRSANGEMISDTKRAFFMGNALVVPVVAKGLAAIARKIRVEL